MKSFNHIIRLGVKELRSLWADKLLLIFLLVAFTLLVYSGAKGTSRELHNAPIAVVDQDRSPLSGRIVGAFYGPYFKVPEIIAELSTLFELAAGDLIYTGTPAGVGPLVRGDSIEAGIEGLDTLTTRIV